MPLWATAEWTQVTCNGHVVRQECGLDSRAESSAGLSSQSRIGDAEDVPVLPARMRMQHGCDFTSVDEAKHPPVFGDRSRGARSDRCGAEAPERAFQTVMLGALAKEGTVPAAEPRRHCRKHHKLLCLEARVQSPLRLVEDGRGPGHGGPVTRDSCKLQDEFRHQAGDLAMNRTNGTAGCRHAQGESKNLARGVAGGSCRLCRFSIQDVRMPRTKPFGAGRTCLVAVPGGVESGPIKGMLASAGFAVNTASTESSTLAALERGNLSAVFVSQKLGPVALSSIVARAAHGHPQVAVIVLGSSTSVQDAVDAMQHGCADYLPPPIEPQTLLVRVRKLLDRQQTVSAGSPPLQPGFMGLVGGSPAIRRVLESIEKISRYKTNVLVLGESGTGKELIARALHTRGPRRQSLFVPLNCATLGRDILENELFGHEKGAFTGANERKQGLFELADGGTLFLDEIGEMDPGTQPKLLRVLERNEFRRVGGSSKVKVDLSVIAATNLKLEDSIRVGKFREDLYYRLKVVTIAIPPLRERKEDIPALIETFIADFNRRHDGKIQGIAPQASKLIMEYAWPGNVRELKNAIDSAAILANGDTIGPESFAELAQAPRAIKSSASAGTTGTLTFPVGVALAQVERELILATLRRYKTKKEAARILGLGLRTLYTKLDQYSINEEPADSA